MLVNVSNTSTGIKVALAVIPAAGPRIVRRNITVGVATVVVMAIPIAIAVVAVTVITIMVAVAAMMVIPIDLLQEPIALARIKHGIGKLRVIAIADRRVISRHGRTRYRG